MVAVSVVSVFLSLQGLLYLEIFLLLLMLFRFRESIRIKIKKIVVIPAIIFSLPVLFIFEPEIHLFDLIPLSSEGMRYYIMFVSRFIVFYSVFEMFSLFFSPRLLVSELSMLGMRDIGIITGITINQIYHLSDILKNTMHAVKKRTGGKLSIKNFSLFVQAVLRHSIRRADAIAFAIYSTGVLNAPAKRRKLFSKKDLEIVLYILILIFILIKGKA